MKWQVWIAALLGVVVASSSADAAVITVFSGNAQQAAFNAAAGTLITEDFNDNILVPGLTIASGNGVIGSPVAGRYNDVVDNPIGGPVDQVTFAFDPAIRAFGGIFDLSPGGPGLGIRFIVTFAGGGTQLVSAEVPNSFTGQFFGFVSDTPIASVQLSGGTQGGAQETFNLDNLQFAQVPEPATLAAFGVMAAAGLGYTRRRLKGRPVVA